MIQLSESEVYAAASKAFERLVAPTHRSINELEPDDLEELRLLTEELNLVLKAKV